MGWSNDIRTGHSEREYGMGWLAIHNEEAFVMFDLVLEQYGARELHVPRVYWVMLIGVQDPIVVVCPGDLGEEAYAWICDPVPHWIPI